MTGFGFMAPNTKLFEKFVAILSEFGGEAGREPYAIGDSVVEWFMRVWARIDAYDAENGGVGCRRPSYDGETARYITGSGTEISCTWSRVLVEYPSNGSSGSFIVVEALPSGELSKPDDLLVEILGKMYLSRRASGVSLQGTPHAIAKAFGLKEALDSEIKARVGFSG